MEPQILANYLLELSSMFHKYYAKNRIINDEQYQIDRSSEYFL